MKINSSDQTNACQKLPLRSSLGGGDFAAIGGACVDCCTLYVIGFTWHSGKKTDHFGVYVLRGTAERRLTTYKYNSLN